MDIATITQIIGSLGFPICACIALFYQMQKQSDQHKQEMDKITESLNNNTVALTRLCEKLGVSDSERI